MQDQLKTAGVVGLVGATLGLGVALGMGLRLFSATAMAGLGTGVALGILIGTRRRAEDETAPPSRLRAGKVNDAFNRRV